MSDLLPTLEQDIEALSNKCNEDVVYKLSSEAKDKILEINKKLDQQLNDASMNLHSPRLIPSRR